MVKGSFYRSIIISTGLFFFLLWEFSKRLLMNPEHFPIIIKLTDMGHAAIGQHRINSETKFSLGSNGDHAITTHLILFSKERKQKK